MHPLRPSKAFRAERGLHDPRDEHASTQTRERSPIDNLDINETGIGGRNAAAQTPPAKPARMSRPYISI